MPSWLTSPTENSDCAIIAEVAQSHDGSLGMAHAFIDAVAESGADAIKFQTHIAEEESTPNEPWRVRFSPQDATRYDYWKRMEFTAEQWLGLKRHCDQRGLLFLSSPFSMAAVELLRDIEVCAWKIASGEVTNEEMLRSVAGDGRPVMLSTGMSRFEEIDRAVEILSNADAATAIMQCTSEYPCSLDQVGLNMLTEYRERYGRSVGLSDHSGSIWPCLAASMLGAKVLEVHVTLSPRMFGPDVPASLSVEELSKLVEGVRANETMLANPQDKDSKAEALDGLRGIFLKKVVAKEDLPAGAVLSPEQIALKKAGPAQGEPLNNLDGAVGKKLRRPLAKNTVICREDLEGLT